MRYTIAVEDVTSVEAGEAVSDAVRRGIREADPPGVGPRDWQPVHLSLRAERTIVGGLYGATMWGWLMIEGLWVTEPLRGQGYGSRLLREAERLALSRNCRGVWLGTFDFQAQGFYERHGYRVFGALTGFPAGHTHYHLWKDLSTLIPRASKQADSGNRHPAL